VPIANVFASLPITLNGLGVREAAYLVLFGHAGLSKPDTIALGLLWFASTMIGGLSGIFAFVTTKLPAGASDDPDSASEHTSETAAGTNFSE
jgi:glycosyltransferase 2 family protein